MSQPLPWPTRLPNRFKKVITFSNAAGSGQVGTVAVGTVTGAVMWLYGYVRCTTDLVGSTATIKFGTTNNTDALITQTLATDIDALEFWQDSTPEAECSPLIVNQGIDGNLIFTVGTATITAGVLEVVFYWVPGSDTGNVA